MRSAGRTARYGAGSSADGVGADIGTQAIAIAAAAFCGLASGLLYDVLRHVRYGAGAAVGMLCDMFFCLCCTAEMFIIGMYFCEHGAGVWEAAAFLAAFAAYIFGISSSISPLFGNFYDNILKKFQKKDK